MVQRAFTEVSYRPPGARINQRENLLACMRVGALRDSEVCHACVERRLNPAVVQVVPGGLHRRVSRPTLVDQRF